jgi:NMD protein affecting ribosome stability and mRNA decay
MAQSRACPKCGTQVPTSEGWAKAAVSLLIPAPAVPDMATQLRCPHCRYVFADGEVRHVASLPSKVLRGLVILACLVVAAWAVYQLF